MKPWIKILIGLVAGVCVGLFLSNIDVFAPLFGSKSHFLEIKKGCNHYLSLLGKVFIDLLKMLVGIIIFSSMVAGICHIHDPKKLSRIGLKTISYYVVTTLLAIGFGVALSFLIKPGAGLDLACSQASLAKSKDLSIIEFLFSIVPSNPIAAFAEGNVLQIILFGVLFAFAIILTGEKAKPVLNVIESVSEVMFSLTHVIMKLAPYGVFALMAAAVSSIGLKVIMPLVWILLCNYIACFLQIFIVFGLSIKYLARLEVGPFFKGMKDAIVVAFTTSSSSATLPISMECAQDHLGVSKDISGFVLSLGSTVNMNGAAIGQAVAAIFIAQAYNIEITFVKIFVLFFTALISAVGAAGIPGTGLVMLSVVLNAMGLPLEGIALVAGIDRLREMLSAVTNVLGDAVAAVYIAKTEKQINETQYHTVTWLE